MKEKLTKVIADNLFATTEQKELSAKKIWEIAEFIAPFVAEAAKEEFMKNAVECEYFDGSLFRNDLREKYRDGDKVKIVIVIKED